ncbi:MAG: leucine--tRNA ligase, partial [Chloroflexi bacterium]|nr:leucine--tRNA ligase [Chloroflexota bacterium]
MSDQPRTKAKHYDPKSIEAHWAAKWEEDELYRAKVDWSKPKHYALTMLPYPSGDLHIGHWFPMTPSDARARYMRMRGYNVLFPMGFDAFGLPAENAAVQRNIHPAKWTYNNVERMRGQLRSMGAMFDWTREVVTCDPAYYHWTEWLFKAFFEAGLAYRGEALVNWSPTLQTVLANEQVIDGKDERTGQPVVQKMMEQWFFRITKYADELLNFDHLDWPEPVKIMQTNWIGRSEGARVTFHTEAGDPIEIYTTRPDTLWGATFMVLAPEHPLVAQVTTDEYREQVQAYQEQAGHATEIERTAEDREKTGVFTGGYAINPVNDERIPIWIADYVMITYGSGAIMAVPAHDQRDFEFARKFGLPVRVVIQPEGQDLDGATMPEAWPHEGVMVNSGAFDGTPATTEKGRKNPAINAVIDWLEAEGIGKEAVNYRLRDWLISRQRYWGSPIPMIKRIDGSYEPVADEDLPVLLPDDVEMRGVGNPLAEHEE